MGVRKRNRRAGNAKPGGSVLRRTYRVGVTLARFGAGLPASAKGEPLERRMRLAAEELGPTFVKLGQLIASSPGMFPEKWTEEMGRCRDQVPTFPFEDARRIVEEDLRRPLESVFAEFGETPIAAASIGQVHPARLRDGRSVVCKVQRPGLEEIVRNDIRSMLVLAGVLQKLPWTAVASPKATAEDFARTLTEEIDFRLEADNMDRMRRHFVEAEITDGVIPEVHWEHVGRRTLTMERIDGIGFTDIEGMVAAGIDTRRLLRMGVQSVVEGVLVYGFFHGDLHAGNMAVLADGRFVLYDFGIVGRLTESVRTRLASYLIATVTMDYEALIRALQSFGSVPKDVDIPSMAREIQELLDPFISGGMNNAELGNLMDTMIKSMVKFKVHIPRELVLLSKQLLYLEGASHKLAPDADLLEEQNVIYNSLMTKYPELAQEFFSGMVDVGGKATEFAPVPEPAAPAPPVPGPA